MSSGKFQKLEDGITLFDNDISPCARRVRMVLIEKDLPWRKIPVDLLGGEQKDPDFLKLNPNGKVPALVIRNVEGVPDCVLYESNVITEFLDASFPGKKLLPDDTWLRTQAKMWMDWELALVDHFVPFVYQNVQGTVIRLQHGTLEKALSRFPPETAEQVLDKQRKIFTGQYKTEAEMAVHSAGCMKQFLILERALEGKEYLVGDNFTLADIAVYPRVAMSTSLGIPMPEHMFPNIHRYKRSLEPRPCFRNSQSTSTTIIGKIMANCRPLLVWLGNKRSGIDFKWFDGEQHVKSISSDLLKANSLHTHDPLPDLGKDDVAVFDTPASVECWQMKLLLEEKGKTYRTVPGDILDLVGCPNGAGGLYMVQHGPERNVTGYRTILEYIDAVFPGKKFLPQEPLDKARSQCWQAWEQAMYFNEIWSIFERSVIAKQLVKRYGDKPTELLNLKTHTKYSEIFPYVMRCFLAGIDVSDARYESIVNEYGHLRGQGSTSQSELDTAYQTYKLRLQNLESTLTETRYLVGNDVSLADICVFCRLQLLPVLGMTIQENEYPNVFSWIKRLEERETYKQVAVEIQNLSII